MKGIVNRSRYPKVRERNLAGALIIMLGLAFVLTVVFGMFQSPISLAWTGDSSTIHYGLPIAWHGTSNYSVLQIDTLAESIAQFGNYMSYMLGFILDILFWFFMLLLVIGALAALRR